MSAARSYFANSPLKRGGTPRIGVGYVKNDKKAKEKISTLLMLKIWSVLTVSTLHQPIRSADWQTSYIPEYASPNTAQKASY